jgi:hypothetical protein
MSLRCWFFTFLERLVEDKCKYKEFSCYNEKSLLILRTCLKILYQLPFLSLVDFRQCPPIIGSRKIRVNLHVLCGFRYDFSGLI